MKFSILKFTFFIFILSLSGCAELAKHVDTVKPTAKLTGMHLANINFEQVDLVFDLAVENRNPVPLNLAGLDYDLKIENQSLVSGVTAQAINIAANSTSPVQLPITLKFSDLKNLPGELWKKDNLAYQLAAQLNLNLPVIGNYPIPVSKHGELPVPKIPDIKLKDIKIKDLSFTTAEIVAMVEIINPNNFDMALSKMNYALNINQQSWGQGNIEKSSNIPKKGKGSIEIPLKLNLLNAGTAAYTILKNKSPLQYQLTGNAVLDTGLELLQGYDMPFDVKGETAVR